MSITFTEKPLTGGEEPTELLRQLAYEYLAELNRRGIAQLLELSGTDGSPILLVVIPNAKVVEDKIVDVPTEKENPS